MKYLITGAAGFIGYHTAKRLLENNNEIIGIDNINDFYDINLKNARLKELSKHENFNFYNTDLTNKSDVLNLQNENKIDAVIHLAAYAGVRTSLSDPWAYQENNVTATLNLLELCKISSIKNFTLASTSSVYGDLKDKKSSNETDKTTPISPYAYSKLAAEEICKFFSDTYSINISILRYFTVYGPSGRPDMSILKFMHKIFNEKPITIYGDGSQKRDFTYITDICEGTFSSSSLDGFNILNLGRSDSVNLMKVVELIQDIVGKPANIEFKPNHPLDVNRTSADISNAKRLIQWTPKVSIQSGLKKTYDWYVNNIDSIDTLE